MRKRIENILAITIGLILVIGLPIKSSYQKNNLLNNVKFAYGVPISFSYSGKIGIKSVDFEFPVSSLIYRSRCQYDTNHSVDFKSKYLVAYDSLNPNSSFMFFDLKKSDCRVDCLSKRELDDRIKWYWF